MFLVARRSSVVILLAVAATGLVACSEDGGSGSDTASSGRSGSGEGTTAIAACVTDDGSDERMPSTAPPTDGADPTIAATGRAAIDANTYGQQFSDTYAGAAVVDGGATVQVGFTADVEEHQDALDERLGEGTVTVVAVDHSLEELNELRSAVADQLVADEVAVGAELDLEANLVAVDVETVNDDSIAAVADAFPGKPICVQ